MFDIVAKKEFKDIFDKAFNWGDTPHYMTTDIKEKDGKCEIQAHLAGFTKDDISVTFDKGNLNIKAEKKEENNDEYTRRESYSSTSRVFFIGEQYSDEDFTANFENGVLNITFDKKEPKQIEIKQIEVK